MFGELFHPHQVWYRRTHWGIHSIGVSFRPSSRWGFSFLRNLAVVDGDGIEPSPGRAGGNLQPPLWRTTEEQEKRRPPVQENRHRICQLFFSVINEGYSVFLPLGRPVFHAVRQDLFDARLAQHQCDQSEWNEPEAHERGQTVADGMRATRMA